MLKRLLVFLQTNILPKPSNTAVYSRMLIQRNSLINETVQDFYKNGYFYAWICG